MINTIALELKPELGIRNEVVVCYPKPYFIPPILTVPPKGGKACSFPQPGKKQMYCTFSEYGKEPIPSPLVGEG
jgi:hypothetical protein